MEIKFSPLSKEHLEYWKKYGDKQIQKKIDFLIEDISKHPYQGIGKSEALKHQLTGSWARRITTEHRLVYRVMPDNTIEIQRLKGHYRDK